jgi:hypothetical protein
MSLGNLAIVGVVAYVVLMIFLVKWWLFDDKTDRLRNHGDPIPRSRVPHPYWPGKGRLTRKEVGGERRMNRSWRGRRRSAAAEEIDLELSPEGAD